jgi:hypothetical protein
MPRAKDIKKVLDDELDGHTPLYDRKEFQRYAIDIVLPCVGKKFASRRRIKLRLGGKHREGLTCHALDYLVLHGKIETETRGQAITFFRLISVTAATVAPKPKTADLPQKQNWSFGKNLPRKQRPPKSSPLWDEMRRGY